MDSRITIIDDSTNNEMNQSPDQKHMKYHYCPECVETRVHPQPFLDQIGRLLCGACWFIDQKEVEMVESDDIFPFDLRL